MQSRQLIYLPPTPESIQRRRIGITLVFLILAVLYSIVTPIFEISDEVSHYPVIDYIADTGELPIQHINRENPWDWEAAQPPLYYVISALIVAPFNRDDLPQHLKDNPHSKVGIGLATDNHNFVLHDWGASPWQGTPLHVHLLRFFSVLLGTGAVWMTFTVARLAVPGNPVVALVAMCLTAFNPMFLAIVGSVNNDNLVTFWVTLALAVMLTLWRVGFAWRRVGALALLGTLAAASKLSGTVIFMPAGLAILLVVWRDRLPLYYVVLAALIFVIVWGALFGWWYVRNMDLYDDPLGSDHMARTVGLREAPISLVELVREEWFSFYAAYWGWFGAVNILAPMRLFYFAGALQLTGATGLLLVGWKRLKASREPALFQGDFVPLSLLLLTVIIAFISLITWTLKTPASQGRLLFPFIAALSTLTALGLVKMLGGRWALGLSAVLLFFALYSITVVIPHAFRLPDELPTLPDDVQRVDVRYGDIKLLGYRVGKNPVQPGDLLEVTLYWQPQAQTQQPLSFYIQAFAPRENPAPDERIEVAKLDSYPGRGLLQTDTWQPDIIYEDVYRLELKNPPGVDYPFEPRLKVGWRDNVTDDEIPATTNSGEPIESVILPGGRVYRANKPTVSNPLAEFGGIIHLQAAHAEQENAVLRLHIVWQALSDIQEDFTVFVQLIDPDAPTQPLAFGDSVPRDGWWRTSLWIPGNRFSDVYTIPLEGIPPGPYQILFGFYRPADFTRLPINTGVYPDAYALDVTVE